MVERVAWTDPMLSLSSRSCLFLFLSCSPAASRLASSASALSFASRASLSRAADSNSSSGR